MTFPDAVRTFLEHGDAAGHTAATRRTYAQVLQCFEAAAGISGLDEFTTEAIEHYLVTLRARVRPVSAHQAYRTLRTFSRWLTRTGRLPADPMSFLIVRAPKTLPRVPADDAVSRLLAACPQTSEGRRNRAIIALLADSGLRKEELRRLRWADVDLGRRLVHVRAGKGQKDGTTFFGETTASLLRTWLAGHPDPQPAAPVCCTRTGTILGPYTIALILGRLSRRAVSRGGSGPMPCATTRRRRSRAAPATSSWSGACSDTSHLP